MPVKLEQIFHTAPKKIGMIEIYSNPMDKSVVKDIEKVINSIAKSFHINLDKIPSGDTLKVYIYPTTRVFFSVFGNELEKSNRKRLNKGLEDLYFIVDDGEIHMVSPSCMPKSYTNMIKILVKDILFEYGVEEKIKKAQDKVKDELESEEVLDQEQEEEELQETEENEENIDEQELEEIQNIDEEIEELKSKEHVKIPEWLDLGWAKYKRGILSGVKNQNDFGDFIKNNGITSLGKIGSNQSVIADYNYDNESSAAIIEYIVENYGVRKIVELFENPDVEKVLHVSKAKFTAHYKKAIKDKYLKYKLDELNVEEKEQEEIVKDGK